MEKFPSISLESFYKNTTLHVIVLTDGVVVPKLMSIADPLPTLRNLREFFKAIKAFAEDKTYIGTMGSETAMLINCDCAEFVMNLGTLMGTVERPYAITNDAATIKEILSKKKSYDYTPEVYAALAKKGYLPKIDLPKAKTSTPEDESEETSDEVLDEKITKALGALAAAGAVPEDDDDDDDDSDEEESEEDEDEYEEEEEEEEEVESEEEETIRKTASASSTPEYSGTPIEKKIYKKIVDAVHPANEEEDKVVRALTRDIVRSILKDMGVL